jgi:hypothetical protein
MDFFQFAVIRNTFASESLTWHAAPHACQHQLLFAHAVQTNRISDPIVVR